MSAPRQKKPLRFLATVSRTVPRGHVHLDGEGAPAPRSDAERRVGGRGGSEGRSDVAVLVSCGQVGVAAEARGQSERGWGTQRSSRKRWFARPGLPPRRPLVR